jgi:hypothetical protein
LEPDILVRFGIGPCLEADKNVRAPISLRSVEFPDRSGKKLFGHAVKKKTTAWCAEQGFSSQYGRVFPENGCDEAGWRGRHAHCSGRGDSIEDIERFRGQVVLMVSMIKTRKKAKDAKVKSAPPTTGTGGGEALKTASPKANRVSLELTKPEAKNVFVAGSFNEWKPEETPLMCVGDGRWAGNLVVKPGRHEYLFVVDGQWLPDPNAKESVQNPFGGRNSVLVVSE